MTQSGGFDVAANTTLGLTGVLSGGGDLIKAGEGVLDLKGDGAGFTYRTLVNGGGWRSTAGWAARSTWAPAACWAATGR
ncbi:hypothetical protein WJ968_19135 [Achromobacter xylosoxidans]